MTQLIENSLTWFKFDAWFVAFWSALAVIAALEILLPAFKRPHSALIVGLRISDLVSSIRQ